VRARYRLVKFDGQPVHRCGRLACLRAAKAACPAGASDLERTSCCQLAEPQKTGSPIQPGMGVNHRRSIDHIFRMLVTREFREEILMIFWLVLTLSSGPLHVGNFPTIDACREAANSAIAVQVHPIHQAYSFTMICVRANAEGTSPPP